MSEELVRLISTVVGAIIGGIGAYLGASAAQREELRVRRSHQAADYQLRIWMELQDALESLDNAIGRRIEILQSAADGRRNGSISTGYFAEATLRTRILSARLTDDGLRTLTQGVIASGRQAIQAKDVKGIEEARNKLQEQIDAINERINRLIRSQNAVVAVT
jgi:hypothetical protein